MNYGWQDAVKCMFNNNTWDLNWWIATFIGYLTLIATSLRCARRTHIVTRTHDSIWRMIYRLSMRHAVCVSVHAGHWRVPVSSARPPSCRVGWYFHMIYILFARLICIFAFDAMCSICPLHVPHAHTSRVCVCAWWLTPPLDATKDRCRRRTCILQFASFVWHKSRSFLLAKWT